MTDIQVLRDGKQCLSAVYEKGNYGLIYQNKIGSKTFRCNNCKQSKNCLHVQRWKTYEAVDADIEILAISSFDQRIHILSNNMLTNLQVAFVGFIMKVLYCKGLIIKKAYTFIVIK